MKLEDRKLGRENAWGIAHIGEGRIEIDPRLLARKRLEIVLHEALHILFPDWPEGKVSVTAKRLRVVLWLDRWRRVQE